MRVAELVGLTLTDIDLEVGTMLMNGKGDKQRTISLEKKATQALRALLSSRSQNTDQQYPKMLVNANIQFSWAIRTEQPACSLLLRLFHTGPACGGLYRL